MAQILTAAVSMMKENIFFTGIWLAPWR